MSSVLLLTQFMETASPAFLYTTCKTMGLAYRDCLLNPTNRTQMMKETTNTQIVQIDTILTMALASKSVLPAINMTITQANAKLASTDNIS